MRRLPEGRDLRRMIDGLIAMTADGGATWTERSIAVGEDDRHLNAITVFAPGQLAIAGESGALFVSTDDGLSWTPRTPPYEGSYFGALGLPEGRLMIYGLRGQAFVLDPSSEKSPQFGAFRSQQMGIDATIKIPERFTEYPEVSKADPAAVAAIHGRDRSNVFIATLKPPSSAPISA